MNFKIEDLAMAYRKAKVDYYYSTHASIALIADYELNLENNLQKLLEKINGSDERWATKDDFIGDWTLAAKKINFPLTESNKPDSSLIFSSPWEEWKHVSTENRIQPSAEFRLMAQASIDFHIFSTLWMLNVGHLFDSKLSNSAYGNRMRRQVDQNINPLSLGSFEPYLKPFRKWRSEGIEAMNAALHAEKKIIALTADVTSFYHELNPEFMLDDEFLKLVGIELKPDDKTLHLLFVKSLKAWARKTPLKKGLPVGLPASAVVANIALLELDRIIEKQVAPIYYGRYVDDILLVMENGANISSTIALWEWLFKRFNGHLDWADLDKKVVRFKPTYLERSEITFSNAKNKVFLLSGDTGKTLINSISRQIHERASEWRALPNLPILAKDVATDLIAATQSDGEAADNLRKADSLTMHRAGFAIKLRDFEAYARDLDPEAWKEHRHAFFKAFTQHVLTLPHFFDLAIYLPRVIRLATACQDFDYLRKLIDEVGNVIEEVEKHCKVAIKPTPKSASIDEASLLKKWKKQIYSTIHDSVVAAFPPLLTQSGKELWYTEMARTWYYIPFAVVAKSNEEALKDIRNLHLKLFCLDLAHLPFRFTGLPKEMIDQRGIPKRNRIKFCINPKLLKNESVINGLSLLSEWLKFSDGIPNGLAYPTRPFTLAELFVLTNEPFSKENRERLSSIVLSLRGFTLTEKMPFFDEKRVLQIPDGEMRSSQNIAVSSWKTDMESWVAAVTRTTDPNHLKRYSRINRLINSLLVQSRRPDYFVLPELSLPAHWFMRIALKLQARRISLITGIEYLHSSRNRVKNQVWCALPHDGLDFSSMMIYRQDKQRPALHEEQEILRLGGVTLHPDQTWSLPPIIQHGHFRFAVLVCSELTNIAYRTALRGKIDALFVPEWNQDTETFNALVESAALDIHAYIIQCNDRQYGDSRIRAPHQNSWRRDVLRVKGGIEDYCVTGEIEVQELRQFQSSYRSASGPFKPVPDGFRIVFERKTLPR